jgi:colanic acid biosynthesis protein WcaH
MTVKPEKIPTDIFMQIVRHAPLISIDLILYNENNEILLGWRNNQPAKDYWFVPGGRIYKNETLREAFSRIMSSETGLSMDMDQAKFHGLYEHLYPEQNFMNEPGVGTHYIVLAFDIHLTGEISQLPLTQHSDYKWLAISELPDDVLVHQYTKNYFNGTRLMG